MRASAGVLAIVAVIGQAYPVSYTSCGVTHVVSQSPQRVVTMNQGATEFLLALGLAGRMVGTAYLDDTIWPQYAQDYKRIPVLSSSYPNESILMGVSPDFIVGSYNSAFREQYISNGKTRGIFNTTIGPCVGNGSDWGETWRTCRPQLHAASVGTYLFMDACEDSSLRPSTVNEDTVYDSMRALGAIFQVNVNPIIQDMKRDFDNAEATISSAMHGTPLNVVWLDCVGRCCSDNTGEKVFVGGATGAPAMLMQEAGLRNIFSNKVGNWVCVNKQDIVAAAPDVIIAVDAAWDTAMQKVNWIYNDTAFCQMDAVRGARFVSIPFSASTLSPRNGPAAHDLALAALHVRLGTLTASRQSGVSSFNPHMLQLQTKNSKCPLQMSAVVYDNDDRGNDDNADKNDNDSLALGLGLGLGIGLPVAALILGAGAWLWWRSKKPSSPPGNEASGVVIGQPVGGPAGDEGKA